MTPGLDSTKKVLTCITSQNGQTHFKSFAAFFCKNSKVCLIILGIYVKVFTNMPYYFVNQANSV